MARKAATHLFDRRALVKSEYPCRWVRQKRILIALGSVDCDEGRKATPCHHRAFRFKLNHLTISLCICHATRFAKRIGIDVSPAK